MRLDEFIQAEARRRAPRARASPQWIEDELIAAMKSLSVEMVRYAREHADVHRQRSLHAEPGPRGDHETEHGAVAALQAFADGVSLSVSRLGHE